MRARPTFAVLIALALPALGCQVPRFEGPEIQQPPANFVRQPNNQTLGPIFPNHEITFHTSWVHTDLGGVSVIYIDAHPTVFGLEDVMAARTAAERNDGDPDAVHGNIEALTIDGRESWGWYREVGSARRGLDHVTYYAVVPYDTVSYALMFGSGEPTLKQAAPDTLRAVVSSFAIGRTTYNLPLIAIVFGAMLLVASVLRSRSRERDARLRSINLVKIKKDDEDADEPAATAGPAASTPGPPPSGAGSGGLS